MSTAISRQPSYRLHKARNCAAVTIDGKNHYLGPYDSPESHEKYIRLIAGWRAGPNPSFDASVGLSPVTGPTVNDVLLVYWALAESYCVHEGAPTRELGSMQEVIRPLRALFGRTFA